MKRCIHLILSALLLLSIVATGVPIAHASQKADVSRTIAIAFDNSGSMYQSGNQAWCRATYAMEVFASMLNKGDTLQIYPMHPITIDGQNYTMDSPFTITDAANAAKIREIFTPDAGGTPIETIDRAAAGLQNIQSNKKYLIVLTDGSTFSKDGRSINTQRELDKRVQAYAGADMSFMYLGIGAEAKMPTTAESEYFKKAHAVDSKDVLSSLTAMCNQIFGRDTLPANHLSGTSVDFDISMSKLIVFVQGQNISNLKITNSSGEPVGQLVAQQQTQFSTVGAGDYPSVPDESLQGMMVTYTDCAAGTYTISHDGTAGSTEVYYEPDADLAFVFTDSEGNDVDPNALYAGEYKMSFGLKDAKTGELITSDLLGEPQYKGSYFINDQEQQFDYTGQTGSVPVTLAKDDAFRANLTATYLSGYTIRKDSSDFGWPEGGIHVGARPAGKLQLQLTAPKDYIVISDLKKNPEIVVKAKLTLNNIPLTAEQLALTTLQVDSGSMGQAIAPQGDSYIIRLTPAKDVTEGNYPIRVTATYTDAASQPAQAEDSLSLTFSNTPLWLKWAIRLGILALIAFIIYRILHIRVLPNKLRQDKNGCSMSVKGKNVDDDAEFSASLRGKALKVKVGYSGDYAGVNIRNVAPGKESYLRKSNKKRSALLSAKNVSGYGTLTHADICGVDFNWKDGVLVQSEDPIPDFKLANGATISLDGILDSKKFHAEVPVTFK